MDKETLYAENKALRTMNLHLSDRTDVLEKAIGNALQADDLDSCQEILREAARK